LQWTKVSSRSKMTVFLSIERLVLEKGCENTFVARTVGQRDHFVLELVHGGLPDPIAILGNVLRDEIVVLLKKLIKVVLFVLHRVCPVQRFHVVLRDLFSLAGLCSEFWATIPPPRLLRPMLPLLPPFPPRPLLPLHPRRPTSLLPILPHTLAPLPLDHLTLLLPTQCPGTPLIPLYMPLFGVILKHRCFPLIR